LRALSQVLGGLPAGFPAALVVVQHLDPHHPSHLAEILAHRTPLDVKQAKEATNRRGKAVRCRITCAPRRGHDHRRVGLILLMEELGAAGDGAFR